MSSASTMGSMSPGLLRVAERARREPDARFHSLAHLIDESVLAHAYQRIRKGAAVGVDGMTKGQYGRDLEGNLRDLLVRLKSRRYRHQPIQRVHIPKGPGTTRPIGISTVEDKIVQDSIRQVLEAITNHPLRTVHSAFDQGETHTMPSARLTARRSRAR